MKVRDQSDWQGQCALWNAPDAQEGAREFQRFVTTWAELAEELLELSERDTHVAALRRVLRDAEAKVVEQHDHIATPMIGQALLVLASHWGVVDSPDDFYNQLNPIEQNLYQDAALIWYLQQVRAAQKATQEAVDEFTQSSL